MLWKVERHGDNDHAEEEEKEGICIRELLAFHCSHSSEFQGSGRQSQTVNKAGAIVHNRFDSLKINFSVGVSI